MEIEFTTPLRVILEPPAAEIHAFFTVQSGPIQVTGENMSSTMQVGTYATVSVAWKDKGGNTVKVDGPTEWKSSDDTVLEVNVATGNPLIANLYAPGPIGKATVHATADADLGEGVRPTTATYDVEVISGEAVGGEITFTQTPGSGGGTQQGGAAPGGGARPQLKR